MEMLAERIRDVLEHGHRVEERCSLEDHSHLLPDLERFLEGEVRNVFAVDRHRPRIGDEEPQDELEDGGLPGTGFPDDCHRLAMPRRERDVLEDRPAERQVHALEANDVRPIARPSEALGLAGTGGVGVRRKLGPDRVADALRLPVRRLVSLATVAATPVARRRRASRLPPAGSLTFRHVVPRIERINCVRK
jgi:hypothetical protein